MSKKKIGFGISASLCTAPRIMAEVQRLIEADYDVYPIITESVKYLSKVNSEESDFLDRLEQITGHQVVTTVIEAEQFGPKNPLDLMVIAPATGNTIAKMSLAHNDNALLMAAKATLRNNKNVVIGISTNDALGLNGVNIMRLLSTKNIYFIPFGQDDPFSKQNSLVAHFELLKETVEAALENRQLQPLLREYNRGL